MAAYIELSDRFGNKLAVLGTGEFALGERSYCLSKIGDCTFSVPVSNPKCTEANFGGKNLVIVRSDTGIPDWGGVIQKATFDGQGAVEVTCRSKEVLLKRQIVDREADPITDAMGPMPAGLFIRDILERKIVAGDIVGLTIGEIYTGGPVISMSALGDDLWDSIIPQARNRSWEMSAYADRKHECYVDADGTFNWLSQRGRDLRSTVLIRGGWHTIKNSIKVSWDWESVITRGWGWGNKSGWEHKLKLSSTHASWKVRYGVLEADADARGNDHDTVLAEASRLIRGPALKFDLTLGVRLPWNTFFVGDLVKVSLPYHGWYSATAEQPACAGIETALRVEAIRVNEETRRLRAVGREWLL